MNSGQDFRPAVHWPIGSFGELPARRGDDRRIG